MRKKRLFTTWSPKKGGRHQKKVVFVGFHLIFFVGLFERCHFELPMKLPMILTTDQFSLVNFLDVNRNFERGWVG